MNKTTNKVSDCSFCSKDQHKVKQIVYGLNACICNECIILCSKTIEENNIYNEAETKNNFNPRAIYDTLNSYIIGQDHAKKILSVAIYNHYSRLFKKLKLSDKFSDIEIKKSNVLMIGPTGCGKTLLMQTIAKIVNMPFTIADATTLTEAGYVGEDVESILVRLLQAADYDIKKAEKGIIYIDEIDKISRKSENPSITRDVSGEGVQQALLKIIEGTIASIPSQGGRKHPQQQFLKINTKDILFICSGAFNGLETIISNRLKNYSIGFESKIKSKKKCIPNISHVVQEDLLKYGLIPEFIGRLPIIVDIHNLTQDMLLKVLKEPKNSLIQQYQKLFYLNGIKLEFEQNSLEEISKIAFRKKTGARGLKSILENILLDIMFKFFNKKNIKEINITIHVVKINASPKVKYYNIENSANERSLNQNY